MVVAVQPRIRLTRSFDERSHSYIGYALLVRGEVGGETREFSVGIGPETHAQHGIRIGDAVSGVCEPIADPRLETVEFYKVSGLTVEHGAPEGAPTPPPWHGIPPDQAVYRTRGSRRLDARTYASKCRTCIWGCEMAVEMIIDHWKPSVRRYRAEAFCYGPKSSWLYRPGRNRVVPGRRGMSYLEEDWVDEEETRHRSPDE